AFRTASASGRHVRTARGTGLEIRRLSEASGAAAEPVGLSHDARRLPARGRPRRPLAARLRGDPQPARTERWRVLSGNGRRRGALPRARAPEAVLALVWCRRAAQRQPPAPGAAAPREGRPPQQDALLRSGETGCALRRSAA